MFYVCITTRNEADNIGQLVSKIVAYGYRVAIVDEGSTDNTIEIAKRAGADVFEATYAKGIGECLMSAWMFAYHSGALRIAQLDAGDSHDPKFLQLMFEGEADVVIGSRFMRRGDYSGNPKRELLSRLAAIMCNLAQSGAKFTDWTSGYRVFSRRAIEVLLDCEYRAKMHGWQIEVLARANEAGLNIVEMPITYKAGRSSFNWGIAWEAFQVWAHIINHIGWKNADSNRFNIP